VVIKLVLLSVKFNIKMYQLLLIIYIFASQGLRSAPLLSMRRVDRNPWLTKMIIYYLWRL